VVLSYSMTAARFIIV
jgi:hypothetical protein